jgi:hypothetical protein
VRTSKDELDWQDDRLVRPVRVLDPIRPGALVAISAAFREHISAIVTDSPQ